MTVQIPPRENLSGGRGVVDVGGETFSTTVHREMPFFVSRDQLYYWMREWQNGEADALRDLEAGHFRRFPDGKSAATWLLDEADDVDTED
jgi:hypothetical protein